MNKLVERFLKYVAIDTASDAKSPSQPSTDKQLNLARILVEEMLSMGIVDAHLDQYGYVYGTVPSNMEKEVPTIGFVAHMDVVDDVPSDNIKPNIVHGYDGKEIVLNQEKGITISPAEYPELLNYVGQDLITTDGTTLLGADDKAGIAEILTAMEYLLENPEVKHGTIKVAFTPDEEISRGTVKFDLEKFASDFAYTVDGGAVGGIDYETFNAASAHISIRGKNIHPGAAKNKMKNALLLAMDLNALLPASERPMHTEGYEGFYHLTELSGTVEQASMKYIIRDHDRARFKSRKDHMTNAVDFINRLHGEGTVTLDLKDHYYNMREKIEPVMHIVEKAREAVRAVGVEPITTPVRGGTDGARLSFMGLPCPNLFTGGHNAHGTHEYIPIQSMDKAVQVILKIVELYAQ